MKFRLYRLLEPVAVMVSLCFTILLSYQVIWAWLFAALSALLYLAICWSRRLYAESFLQLFYLVMAYVGFRQWGNEPAPLFRAEAWTGHLLLISGGALISFILGRLLQRYTQAALAYTDSFTTVFSILATFMMVFTDPVHWLYWIVIDATGIYLYYQRGLYASAALFAVYTALAINGFWQW